MALIDVERSIQRYKDTLGSSRPEETVHGVFLPALCSLDGQYSPISSTDTSGAVDILHHDSDQSAQEYPLRISEGHFFSEVFAADFPEVEEYREHILKTLNLIVSGMAATGTLAYDDIDTVGQQIQGIDAEFAKRKINNKLDIIHQQYGPNPEHPYRKITLIRTTVPVQMEDGVKHFFFEKFLVVYSFLDKEGVRKSTITPIHSHPYNHEVVYFVKRGLGSRAVEREYLPTDATGVPFFSEAGVLNPELVNPDGSLALSNLKIRFEKEETLEGTDEPVILEPFQSEYLSRNPHFIFQTDGLFRPHQVTIHDSEGDGGTFYYAFNNYWGPLGRVIVYNEAGEPLIWNHKEWDK